MGRPCGRRRAGLESEESGDCAARQGLTPTACRRGGLLEQNRFTSNQDFGIAISLSRFVSSHGFYLKSLQLFRITLYRPRMGLDEIGGEALPPCGLRTEPSFMTSAHRPSKSCI